ncbi:MAG: hypothetical protein KatS3mg090_0038 [Patescibacteria group bacterium]|nr:MAG: hypothetical protein KatS3mg090_0038 [Patescibacteria group bacterium]
MFFKYKNDQTDDIKLKLKQLIKDKIRVEKNKQLRLKILNLTKAIILFLLFILVAVNIYYSQTNKTIFEILSKDISGQTYLQLSQNRQLKKIIDTCCVSDKTLNELKKLQAEKEQLKQRFQQLLSQSPFDWRIRYNLKILSEN